jgi:hypothetical protein
MTNLVVYGGYDSPHPGRVMDTDQLLMRLQEKGVRNVDIARALGLPESRIPEIKKRTRALKLDEAAKLVQAFRLEQTQEAPPLHPSVLRLAVQYVAVSLGVPLEGRERQIEELSEDLRAFSAFVSDPKVRSSVEAAEGFFQAMRLRRPATGEAARQGSDPGLPN